VSEFQFLSPEERKLGIEMGFVIRPSVSSQSKGNADRIVIRHDPKGGPEDRKASHVYPDTAASLRLWNRALMLVKEVLTCREEVRLLRESAERAKNEAVPTQMPPT
jgi:hypothetical protein